VGGKGWNVEVKTKEKKETGRGGGQMTKKKGE